MYSFKLGSGLLQKYTQSGSAGSWGSFKVNFLTEGPSLHLVDSRPSADPVCWWCTHDVRLGTEPLLSKVDLTSLSSCWFSLFFLSFMSLAQNSIPSHPCEFMPIACLKGPVTSQLSQILFMTLPHYHIVSFLFHIRLVSALQWVHLLSAFLACRVSSLLASLGHSERRRVVSGHRLNRETLMETENIS